VLECTSVVLCIAPKNALVFVLLNLKSKATCLLKFWNEVARIFCNFSVKLFQIMGFCTVEHICFFSPTFIDANKTKILNKITYDCAGERFEEHQHMILGGDCS